MTIFFDKYSTDSMSEFLEEHIPFKKNITLGQKLGKVRNLILHPNAAEVKSFKSGKSLDHISLLNISEVIFLVLLRALYTKLGVSQKAIDKLGTKDSPVIREHFHIR